MELLIFYALAILLRTTAAAPIPNCDFPAPVIRPLAGVRVTSCSSADLERQKQAAYDEASIVWLEKSGIMSEAERSKLFPSTTQRSLEESILRKEFEATGAGSSDGDSEDPLSAEGSSALLTPTHTEDGQQFPNHKSDGLDDGTPSLFDLPSAAHQVHGGRTQTLEEAIARATRQGMVRTHSLLSRTSTGVIFLVAVGMLFALGIMARIGELLLRLCRVTMRSSRGQLALCCDVCSGEESLPNDRDVRSSFEFSERDAKGPVVVEKMVFD